MLILCVVNKALLFPGQGSQCVGMGKDFYETFPVAKHLFQEAEDILSLPLSKIMFGDQDDVLRQTRYAQPALFVFGACMVRVMEDVFGLNIGGNFSCVAGHSLGEYTALYAARAVTFDRAMQWIKQRYEAMQQIKEGGMVAVLGLHKESIQTVLDQVRDQGAVCFMSNENSPQQTVISGLGKDLDLLTSIAQKSGASKVVKLNVSGPFHCPLMQPAQDIFEPYLAEQRLSCPVCPVISNATGAMHEDPVKLHSNLRVQMIRPVLWVQTQVALDAAGVSHLYEMGPGRVLSSLARKTIPHISSVALSSVGLLEKHVDLMQNDSSRLTNGQSRL
jgi:[acyl-carrier-protein] S-malonyltransferase